jgi:hypothetical protein
MSKIMGGPGADLAPDLLKGEPGGGPSPRLGVKSGKPYRARGTGTQREADYQAKRKHIQNPEAPFGNTMGGKPAKAPQKGSRSFFKAQEDSPHMTRQNFNRRFRGLEEGDESKWYSKIPKA